MSNIAHMPFSEAERKAVALYAVAARDITDFIEMLGKETNPVTLRTLLEMVSTPNTDPDLPKFFNELVTGMVEKRCKALGLV